jgi:hypothetical protein
MWKPVVGCGLLAAVTMLFTACRESHRSSSEVPASEPVETDARVLPSAPERQHRLTDAAAPPGAVASEPPAPAEPTAEESRAEPAEEAMPRKTEYDPQKAVPLVPNADQLQRLHPSYPVWFDKSQRQVVIVGQICARDAPLEMFACPRGTKEHEAIVVVDTEAYVVHAGLVAAGADPGNPVQFYPEYIPASGPEIEVSVVWEDEKGQRLTARAQDWIRNAETGEVMNHPWVFTGSKFSKDEQTGKEYYQADGGDFICVSNFPSAMLDLPIKSSDSNESLMFRAYTERIPPLGTPVTLILKPKAERVETKAEF